MLFDKKERKFNIQTIVLSYDWKPLIIIKDPYEEIYPFWQLLYVSRGSIEVSRDGETQTVKAGEIIFRPPNQKSILICEKNCELYLGIIDFICDAEAMNFFGTHPIALDTAEQKQISDIIKEASAFCKEDNFNASWKEHDPNTLWQDGSLNTLWQDLISSSLESFLIRIYGRMKGIFLSESKLYKSNTHNNISDKVNQINLFLENRRFENITIEEIASIMHDSPNTIMKYYKKEMNESIIDHFLNLKLQTAIHLIRVSKMNFTEISEMLGFSSFNYFSKFFKKRTGMTLTEFSKQLD